MVIDRRSVAQYRIEYLPIRLLFFIWRLHRLEGCLVVIRLELGEVGDFCLVLVLFPHLLESHLDNRSYDAL